MIVLQYAARSLYRVKALMVFVGSLDVIYQPTKA